MAKAEPTPFDRPAFPAVADHIASPEPSAPVAETGLDEALRDAERLLKYAAEAGIEIDDTTRNSVLHARLGAPVGWTETSAADLLTALTKLSVRMRPVTAESLKACRDEPCHAVRGYLGWAISLAIVIIPFSFASFVTSGFSEEIRKDVTTANELAVKLTAQLHATAAATEATAAGAAKGPVTVLPPGLTVVEVVGELQQFAALIRSIDDRARRLNVFLLFFESDPYQDIRKNQEQLHFTFQLPPELPTHLEAAADDRVFVFQNVRTFAQNLQDDVATFYGAIATCILPVLYALLGTCAYLLRTFEQDMTNKVYVPSQANSARFLIAAISGGVVGLFNNFTVTQGASVPPLAIAFLAGYAVDVFFSFLEGLLQAFGRTKGAPPQGTPPAGTTAASR